MIKEIADPERLLRCAQQLKKKRFKPGFDHMDAPSALLWVSVNRERLSRQLLSGSYEAMPASGFHIAKNSGGYRRLARLTAIDAIIQYSILEVITPVCEAAFSPASFAYRPGCGVGDALRQYCRLGTKHPFAAKLDPVACFDNLDHRVLEQAVFSLLGEKAVTGLIMQFVTMPVLVDGELVPTRRGILQGAPLSALLCNIYFHGMDLYLGSCGIPHIRYADDLVLFAESASQAEERLALGKGFLEERLHLKENPSKTRVDAPAGLVYLGHTFQRDKLGRLSLANSKGEADPVFRTWQSERPHHFRHRTDILSNGILRKKGFSIEFASEVKNVTLPIETTDIINVHSNVIFDSDFLRMAADNGVIINIFDRYDRPVGRFLPAEGMKNPKVTIQQLALYADPAARLALAKKFLLASVHNTRLVIRYYRKQREKPSYEAALRQIQQLTKKVAPCNSYEQLLLIEAQLREAYYACYDSFIEGGPFLYEKRSRRPPKNEINAMLSFGNTVLYHLIATEICKTALDVRVGFLHATNTRKESLNLDLAEIFKPLIVDRTVFSLVNLRVIRPEHFRREENGACYLNETGKALFLKYFYGKLDSTLTMKEQTLSYQQLIQREIHALIHFFKGTQDYRPFKQVR